MLTRAPLPLLLVLALLPACAGSSPSVPPDQDGRVSSDRSGPAQDAREASTPWFEAGGGNCGPTSCNGCCLADGTCVAGFAHSQCGSGGARCVDCAKQKSVCQQQKCLACTRNCKGKTCGSSDGCGGTCQPGSGCCTPKCQGVICGQPDGCGGTCQAGSGCCSRQCQGIPCGSPDNCGGTCQPGSGCCTPSCAGKRCGESDGCGGTCKPGGGCCEPSCAGKNCGDPDDCGKTCSGPCPGGWATCDSSHRCKCGSYPSYKEVSGVCLPSCGVYLKNKGLPDAGGGCCTSGCKKGIPGSLFGETHDCDFCCSSSVAGVSSCR